MINNPKMYLWKHYIVKRWDNVFVSMHSPIIMCFSILLFGLSVLYNKFSFSRNIGNVFKTPR